MNKLNVETIDLSKLGPNNNLVVVSFDVKDDKRRYRLTKFLKAYGIRIQYSLYECVVNNYYYSELCKNITKYIVEEDKVRIYKLTSNIEIKDIDRININIFNKTMVI